MLRKERWNYCIIPALCVVDEAFLICVLDGTEKTSPIASPNRNSTARSSGWLRSISSHLFIHSLPRKMAEDRLLCGDGAPLWDWDLSWNSERPFLSPCFRRIVLSVVPCSVLWLTTALDWLTSRKRQSHQCGPYPWTTLAVCKQLMTFLLAVLTVVQGLYHLYQDGNVAKSRDLYLSLGLKFVTYILALCLQFRLRREGHITSLKLAFFWNLLAVAELLASPLYDLFMGTLSEQTDEVHFSLGIFAFSLVASEAFISHFTDPQYSLLFSDSKFDEYLIEHQAPLSRLLFSWLSRLMWYGYKNILCVDDLDALPPDARTSHVCDAFLESWNKEKAKASAAWKRRWWQRGPSLCMSLARVIWPWMLVAAFLELSFDFITLTPPIVLNWLITFIEDESEPFWHGPIYALLLFGAAALSNLIMVHNQNFLIRASVLPRSGLNAAIYRKVFRLSLGSRRGYSLGELCNLVTVDAQRIFELVWSVNLLWSNPLRILLTVALLWRYLGIACLAGVAALITIMPLTAVITVRTHKVQRTQMEFKDSRLRLMNEIVNGIKVLKLFAWEPPFLRKVEQMRELETKSLRKLAFLNGFIVFLWILAPFLVALCSFVTFVLIDEKNILDPATAFVSLTLFAKLRGAMSSVPQIIAEVVRSQIAFRRVFDFLMCDELEESDKFLEMPSPGNVLELEKASFSWGEGSGEAFLRDINLKVRRGDLVAVVGRVGAGKSALLSAILGEMTRTQGSCRREKNLRLAYVPQTAWIQNATLRQNVLFVNPMDKRRYDSIIRRCCLKPDLKTLPGSDHTEIGEKGVNLSGGQKQRVNLARAVYHEADLYLMDDPLSAVDAHVSSRMFEDVIGPKGTLAQKTRILVTHDLSVLRYCDAVIMMSEGRIAESGTYKELLAVKDGQLSRLINEFQKDQEKEDQQLDDIAVSPDPSSLTTEELKAQMRRLGDRMLSRTISMESEQQPRKASTHRLIDSERMEVGRVQAGVYCAYFRSTGFILVSLMFASFAAHQAFEIGSNVWLSAWSTDAPLPDGSQNIPLRNLRMAVYGLLGLAQGTCILTGAVLLALASTRASIRLHKCMLRSVIRSPLSFFESTPLGRILNRFGKDMDCVDVAIPPGLSNVVSTLASAVGILVVICFNHPLFLLIMVPIAILYIFFQLFYVATSRQLRRLQSVTLSPVLSYFSESVQGTSTIRAFECQGFFTQRHNSLVDDNCKVFLNTTFVNRWLGVHLELMGAVIVLVVALLSVFQRSESSAALVGLTLSYALNVTEVLRLMVRLLTQLETRMVSVERIDEYSRLEEEASWMTDRCHLSLSDWPNEGSVVFKGYRMRYRPGTELVLKGIDLDIPGGQKVGVVGRTGAGKSSLALALFRVVEPCDGQLLIDGVDAAALGLHDLRSKITIIPQDPVLFGGDLRLNLDPIGVHTDQEIAEALRLARIDGVDLATRLDEGGENFSVGQRQQVCLARALLQKSRVLVLDEATAAVDPQTDRLIQETLRTEFADCTLLTVAHRLHTVLDYDRILVMDNGRIAEDGPPDTLLKRKNSMFKDLARSAGLL